MENVSKALIIAGTILVIILIVAAGMFITTSSQGTVSDSMASMSTQEIDAFNLRFTMYEGEQTGTNIKTLVGTLITNSNTYKDEVTKIPGLYLEAESDTLDSGIPEIGKNSEYINELGKIKNNIDAKHKYWVEISYQDNGIIDYINISYEKDDKIEPMFRK